jgi:hypothetical protein
MMKKFAFIVGIFLICAAGFDLSVKATTGNAAKPGRPYLQIELVYNYDVYRRPLFFLPKSQPTFGIWIKDRESGRLESVFVTEKAARNDWNFADSRPESIPVWYGIREIEKENNTFDVDAVSGATPKGNTAVIYWSIPADLRDKTVDLYIEANNSFDFNAYYNKEKESSGFSGANGQPSVVWKAAIDFGGPSIENITPQIIGHGSVLGKTHQILTDTSNITTASQTFQSIRISYFLH